MAEAQVFSLQAARELREARDQAAAERACGVGHFRHVRAVDGSVVVGTSLDDEALVMAPDEARALATHILLIADAAEAEGPAF